MQMGVIFIDVLRIMKKINEKFHWITIKKNFFITKIIFKNQNDSNRFYWILVWFSNFKDIKSARIKFLVILFFTI